MSVRSISRAVTKALGGVAREAGDVAGKTMGITRATTVRALRGARLRKGETPEMLEQVMEETMTGALQGGKDAASDLGSVVKGAVIGTVDGVGTLTAVTGDVVRYATRAAIRSIAAVDGDVGKAAKIAVEAGTEAGERAGLGHDEAASASAAGALDATEGMDDTVAAAVAKSIAETASEIRTLVQERLRKQLLVLVDSNRSNAEQLGQSLKHRKYDVRIATSLSQLDQMIQSREKAALVVIDLAGLDQTVWESCQRLQAARIPFLVIAHQRSPSIQQESIRYGARGVFTKPVGVKELAEHIRATLGR
jgi:CheY-like chemotaxis protein